MDTIMDNNDSSSSSMVVAEATTTTQIYNPLEHLCYDAVLHVLQFLSPKDLLSFGLVSKECAALSSNDYFVAQIL
ncbi:hypothetical protein SAMD00019534_075150 [Acytostelium subglobosum LB1]|uniref:hypothetical protein n=1 Tax=Acytostelium subglobosum LB1 TaxID=1410327 RepID=UPI00064511BA|nr:hypothetical protein SAMD00019534_075150 [Acytostelium subglobosum LB1]GAM24340.1 hypothetical protein SAMD00019534_075150 [Acytostelium subglobosum LB1]|eukprot:XP_012752666.1 hypothetical protein SAMD00019534_075150 [Acytostelium subglobosum LB1]